MMSAQKPIYLSDNLEKFLVTILTAIYIKRKKKSPLKAEYHDRVFTSQTYIFLNTSILSRRYLKAPVSSDTTLWEIGLYQVCITVCAICINVRGIY